MGRASLRNKPFEERADGIPTAPFAYPQYPAGVRVEDGAATGAGEALAAGATGTTATVVAGAATAAVTTLATQASIALINNQGEIGKALDDMGSSQNVKNLLTAIVTGGALAYINQPQAALSKMKVR